MKGNSRLKMTVTFILKLFRIRTLIDALTSLSMFAWPSDSFIFGDGFGVSTSNVVAPGNSDFGKTNGLEALGFKFVSSKLHPLADRELTVAINSGFYCSFVF